MRPLRLLLSLPIAAGLLGLGSCADAPTGPAVLVPAGELEAALSIAARLPTFAALADEALAEAPTREAAGPDARADAAGAAERLRAARELAVRAAESSDEEEAARLRGEAWAAGVVPLAQLLGAEDAEKASNALAAWLEIAEGLLGQADLPGTREALLDGRMLLDRSREAAAAGDHVTAVAALVASADRLSQTTPHAVLRRLLPELEAELAAADAGNGRQGRDRRLERAERLLRGAREAFGAGEHVLGLRRAYYARQLLRAAGAPAQ